MLTYVTTKANIGRCASGCLNDISRDVLANSYLNNSEDIMSNMVEDVTLQMVYDELICISNKLYSLSSQESIIGMEDIVSMRSSVDNIISALCDTFPSIENMCNSEDEDIMADADALKSAGWGTDEDYGSGTEHL